MMLVFIGPPGAGKGSQGDLLVNRKKFVKISTGDALRKHVRAKSEIGKKAASYIDSGNLVPDNILLGIIEEELRQANGRPVLLDGYPRNEDQAKALDRLDCEVSRVIFINLDREELMQRLGGRRICFNCGATYHQLHKPPLKEGTCDLCSGTVGIRSDDSEEKIKVRLDVYESSTKPILDYYEQRGLLNRIDGKGSLEEVYKRLTSTIEDLD